MATITDHQIIQYLQEGRREALAQLFERYSADLYDFLARLVGDRDQASRLLEEVFLRVPGAVAGLPVRESVRGWLYSLAREAGLTWLRQRGWLDGLPPSEEPGPVGLATDIWKTARAMPAFYRAVLIVEELHALSPTEKARALGVQRTDLPRLVDEARKSFTRIFDTQARAEGRPTSAQIDTERIIGLRRRINNPSTTLFSFLPVLVLPDSLQQVLRQRITQAMTGQPVRPIEAVTQTPGALPAEIPPQPPPPPPAEEEVPEPEPRTVATVTTTTTQAEPEEVQVLGTRTPLPIWAIAALAGIALAIVVCGLFYLFTRDTTPPVIGTVQPADGSIVPDAGMITLGVSFTDNRGVDPARCCKLFLDGTDITALSSVDPNAITWTGPVTTGQHTSSASVTDRAGLTAPTKTWHFVVAPVTTTVTTTPLPTAQNLTPTEIPSLTPLASPTPLPPAETATFTPLPTETPSPTAIPSPTNTSPPPATNTPVPPSATPCLVGIFGKVFNDLNSNQVRDNGEPTLSGAMLNLQNSSGQTIATAYTDAFGSYQFVNLPFGTYRVQAATPTGWSATTPTLVTVNMFGCGAFIGLDFGFVQFTPTPPTNTPTNTTVPPSSTPTNTTVPPTNTPTNTTVPPTNTATATPTTTVPPSNIVSVTVDYTPPVTITCPITLTFTGTITVSQPGPVTYRWLRSNNSSPGSVTLTFLNTSPQTVTDSWTIPGAPLFHLDGWDRLDILDPSPTPTPQPTPSAPGPNQKSFSINCPP